MRLSIKAEKNADSSEVVYRVCEEFIIDQSAVHVEKQNRDALALIKKQLIILEGMGLNAVAQCQEKYGDEINKIFQKALSDESFRSSDKVSELMLEVFVNEDFYVAPMVIIFQLLVDMSLTIKQEACRDTNYLRDYDFFDIYHDCYKNLLEAREVYLQDRCSVQKSFVSAERRTMNPLNSFERASKDNHSHKKKQFVRQLALFKFLQYIESHFLKEKVMKSHCLSMITLLTVLRYCARSEGRLFIKIDAEMKITFSEKMFPYFEGFLSHEFPLIDRVALAVQQMNLEEINKKELSNKDLYNSFMMIEDWLNHFLTTPIASFSVIAEDGDQFSATDIGRNTVCFIPSDEIKLFLKEILLPQIKQYAAFVKKVENKGMMRCSLIGCMTLFSKLPCCFKSHSESCPDISMMDVSAAENTY